MKNLDHIKSLPELIDLAIYDTKWITKLSDYKFSTEEWHDPEVSQKCIVDMCGCIMANTLGCRIDEISYPEKYDHRTKAMFYLIDNIRLNYIDDSLEYLKFLGWEKYKEKLITSMFIVTEEWGEDFENCNIDAWEHLAEMMR